MNRIVKSEFNYQSYLVTVSSCSVKCVYGTVPDFVKKIVTHSDFVAGAILWRDILVGRGGRAE